MAKKLFGTNYPLSTVFIVVNEFCERFSFYGMKTVLMLYFLSYLKWNQNLSTAVYHGFSSLCYFTPVLGAIIADSWLGKFKTIIYLSIVYVIGHLFKSVGAIPTVGDGTTHVALSILGLILIGFGTGGIKPCVAAFGGDQFDEENVIERARFFSMFYMAVNAGALLSTVITPLLRADVTCFGGDCYALAFGIPAALMIVALGVFIAGSGMYKKDPPQGNVVLDVCKCIRFAISNRWKRSKKDPPREHWLDWAEEKYSSRLITEIKMILNVLVLFIPFPMFWALFDQQGSRWTLQATRMNLAFGDHFNLKPDQMQMINPLLILLMVPMFDFIIYPLIGFCKIKVTPLRKMAAGMIFAALAFGVAMMVEVNVVKTMVAPAPPGACLLQVFNLAENDVTLKIPESDLFKLPIGYLQDPAEYVRLPLGGPIKELKMEVTLNGLNGTSECTQTFTEQEAHTLILYRGATGVLCELVKDHTEKSASGDPLLRFINTQSEAVTLTVREEKDFQVPANYDPSPYKTVTRKRYPDVKCHMESKSCSSLDLGQLDFGATYTVLLLEKSGKLEAHRMEDVKASNVHIAWQVPMYVLITAGEVMFSITGLEFSYSQAPASMKSVLQAAYLLTVAFGNIIVLIVAEGAGLEQWVEFLLFAILSLAVCLIFSIMAHFYTYVDPDEVFKGSKGVSGNEEEEDATPKKNQAEEVDLNTIEASNEV